MCTSPTAPTTAKDTKSEAPPAVNTAMADLSILALACDRTRVLTYMFSLPAAHVYYRHLTDTSTDMNADFHDTICHGDAGDMSNQPRVDKGVMYAMNCLNEFLTKMQATPHGATNLLDQALVYVTSDSAWGKTHTKTEWPVLLAGKAGGKLKGDGHFNFPGDNLSKALFTAARLMGSTATDYGLDAGKVTGHAQRHRLNERGHAREASNVKTFSGTDGALFNFPRLRCHDRHATQPRKAGASAVRQLRHVHGAGRPGAGLDDGLRLRSFTGERARRGHGRELRLLRALRPDRAREDLRKPRLVRGAGARELGHGVAG